MPCRAARTRIVVVRSSSLGAKARRGPRRRPRETPSARPPRPGRRCRGACSKAAARPTQSVTSAKTSGPLRRRRTLLTPSTPGTRLHGRQRLRADRGDAVQQVVDRLLAQLQADQTTITATPRAATASAAPATADRTARPPARRTARRARPRGPDVGREVQGVGLQGLAIVLLGDPPTAPASARNRPRSRRPRPGRPRAWHRRRPAAVKNSRCTAS